MKNIISMSKFSGTTFSVSQRENDNEKTKSNKKSNLVENKKIFSCHKKVIEREMILMTKDTLQTDLLSIIMKSALGMTENEEVKIYGTIITIDLTS